MVKGAPLRVRIRERAISFYVKEKNMNIYDTINQLSKEIKETKEYTDFKEAKQAISLEPEFKIKISEFEKARYEEQLNTIQTGKTDNEKMAKIQNLYAELIEIPEIKKYFDAEFKFNILLGDINKTISEAVKDVMG